MQITCMPPFLDTFWLHSILLSPPADTRRKGWEGMVQMLSKMIPGPTLCSPIHYLTFGRMVADGRTKY